MTAIGPTETLLPRRSAVWRDAVATLTAYAPTDAEQIELRTAYLQALDDDGAVFKGGPPTHLTASCIVFDDSGERVLLTMHAKARLWLQFGGHVEHDDPTLYAAVQREVLEESGLDSVRIDPRIVELHRHALGHRFGRCEEHLDVRFAGWAPPDAEPVCSTESLEVRWWDCIDLPDQIEEEIGALIRRGQGLGAHVVAAPREA